MALEIPHEALPFFAAYDIPWPDVDEDAFHLIPAPLKQFGSDLQAVGTSIESALTTLEQGSGSHTLKTLVSYAQSITKQYLKPINQVCDDLAGAPCSVAYDLIFGAKWSAIGLVTAEVTADVAGIVADVATVGLAALPDSVADVTLGRAIDDTLRALEVEVPQALASSAGTIISNDLNGLVQDFMNKVMPSVEQDVDNLVAKLAFYEDEAHSAESSFASSLHVTDAELDACIGSIAASSDHLESAIQKLSSAVGELFAHPASNAPHSSFVSSALRIALNKTLSDVQGDLLHALSQLVGSIVTHFVDLVNDYRQALNNLDAQSTAAARKHHGSAPSRLTLTSSFEIGGAVAGGLATITGLVNGSEADSVRAASATADESTSQVSASVDGPDISVGIASQDPDVDYLVLPTAPPPVTEGAAGSVDEVVEVELPPADNPVETQTASSTDEVDSLATPTGPTAASTSPATAPSASPATAPAPSVETLAVTHHTTARHVGTAEERAEAVRRLDAEHKHATHVEAERVDASSASKVKRLDNKEPHHVGPKVTHAQSTAEGLDDLHVNETLRTPSQAPEDPLEERSLV